MQAAETKMFQLLTPLLGQKGANALCYLLGTLYPAGAGAAGGSLLAVGLDWQHVTAAAAVGGFAAGAIFQSIKLLIDFTRGKNKEVNQIVAELLKRQDDLRKEQREFYLEREGVLKAATEFERSEKHRLVNLVNFERQKFTMIKKGITAEEVEKMFPAPVPIYDIEEERRIMQTTTGQGVHTSVSPDIHTTAQPTTRNEERGDDLHLIDAEPR